MLSGSGAAKSKPVVAGLKFLPFSFFPPRTLRLGGEIFGIGRVTAHLHAIP